MPFAAFPHQINDPVKLRRMLQLIDSLLQAGISISDDNFGDALFLEGFSIPQGASGLSLSDQLEIVKRKPKQDQSQRTISRDIRRFFSLAGLLENSSEDHNTITERGKRIVNTPSDSELTIDEKKVWLEGIQKLTLPQPETGTTFRPLRIMLELLFDGPIETRLLTFAFTATDETDAEIARIKAIRDRIISGRSSFENELERNGVSKSNARNSVKILPALMQDLGLISREGRITSLTTYGRTLLDRQVALVDPVERVPAIARRRLSFFRAITPDEDLTRTWNPEDTERGEIDYDPQDAIDTRNLLRERTDEHQETLTKIVRMYRGKDWRLGYGHFDLITEKNDMVLLFEVKTLIEGNIPDERLRLINGLGKLMFYERFDVPAVLKNQMARVQKILFFSRKPSYSEHISLLTGLEIWCLWFNERGELDGDLSAKEGFQGLLN